MSPTTPPFLYLPCTVHDGDQIEFEIRPTKSGSTALVAYSTVDLLLAGCGFGQAWRVLTADELEHLVESHGIDMVVTDIPKPEALRVPGQPPPAEAFPPVTVAPTLGEARRREDVVLAYIHSADETVLPLYSSVERLSEGFGATAPWVVVETSQLEQVREAAHFDRIVLDHPVTVTGVEG